MTDRVHSLTVILAHDYRTDDVEALIDAIALLRGVLRVEENVADVTSLVAESRARHEWREKIWTLFKEDDKP